MVDVPGKVACGEVRYENDARFDVPVLIVYPEFDPDQARQWIEAGDVPELARAKHPIAVRQRVRTGHRYSLFVHRRGPERDFTDAQNLEVRGAETSVLTRSATMYAMATTQTNWNSRYGSAFELLVERVRTTETEVGSAWPYHSDPSSGIWETTDDGDWCGGHWVECLRIASVATGDARLQDAAMNRTERLRPYLERDDQFRGHRFYYSAARQFDAFGDPRMRTLALAAAYAMRSMAMKANGAMPIGTQVQVKSTTLASRSIVAVDNVHPNVQLDWWARRTTQDAAFEHGVRRHLDTTIRDFVRPDGSTVEFIEYDPETGHPLREFTLLGAHDHSCWSRGQAWAIAGYLRAWEELGDTRYLDVARKLLAYWTANSDATMVPPWDFMDPSLVDNPGAVPVDTSASAIVVEQLARIAVHPSLGAQAPDLVHTMHIMLNGLLGHLTETTDAKPGRLRNGCFNQPNRFANHSELVWGSAYLLFALHYLKHDVAPA